MGLQKVGGPDSQEAFQGNEEGTWNVLPVKLVSLSNIKYKGDRGSSIKVKLRSTDGATLQLSLDLLSTQGDQRTLYDL